MILSLDTSTPTCHLWLDDEHFSYETNRNLAKDLLKIILDSIEHKLALEYKNLPSASGESLPPDLLRNIYRRVQLEKITAPRPCRTSGHSEIFPECNVSEEGLEEAFRNQAKTNEGKESEILRGEALKQITAIAIFKGPGSFTGLRIGLTVANALADQLNIPILGVTGKAWRTTAKTRLKKGENDQIVLPLYGKPANITSPKS